MSPRAEREAAMDDMSDFAATEYRPAVVAMSTPALLAEVDAGLTMRVCRQQTTARDVLLVQALAQRLQAAAIAHALTTRSVNREALDGALWLDIRSVA